MTERAEDRLGDVVESPRIPGEQRGERWRWPRFIGGPGNGNPLPDIGPDYAHITYPVKDRGELRTYRRELITLGGRDALEVWLDDELGGPEAFAAVFRVLLQNAGAERRGQGWRQ